MAVLSVLFLALWFGLLAMKGFALADCLGRPGNTFFMYETLSKQAWTLILVLALLLHLVDRNPLGIFNLAGTVAAMVYLAQVRGSSR
jgi:hypothetical protein